MLRTSVTTSRWRVCSRRCTAGCRPWVPRPEVVTGDARFVANVLTTVMMVRRAVGPNCRDVAIVSGLFHMVERPASMGCLRLRMFVIIVAALDVHAAVAAGGFTVDQVIKDLNLPGDSAERMRSGERSRDSFQQRRSVPRSP